MENDNKYYDLKWEKVISQLPTGGDYYFQHRQAGYNIIKSLVKEGSKVFDYACGLGIIDEQLEKEKGCEVAGNDFSKVACNHAMKVTTGEFKQTTEVFGGTYDYILAIYFLEHIKEPVKWLDEMMNHTDIVIVALPNNFRHVGEHIDMQWSNWDEFDNLFKAYNIERVDEGKYPESLHHAFRHPIIKFTKKGNNNARITDPSTTEKANEEDNKNTSEGTNKKEKSKRVRRTRAEIEAERNL